MIKTYTANSHISINVVLPDQSNMHVSFVALSDGRSVYSTKDEHVQTGLERHYNFGKLFFLDSCEEASEKDKEVHDDGKEGKEGTGGSEDAAADGAAGDELTEVEVTDVMEAKGYLADKFGLSRTKLRTSEIIKSEAAARGIKFVGI